MKNIFTYMVWSLLLLCGSGTLAMAGQLPYRVSFYHSPGPLDLRDIGGLSFRPLEKASDLPVMDNRGTYLFRIDFDKVLEQGGLVMFIENEHLDTVSLYRLQGGSLLLVERRGNDFPQLRNRFGAPDFSLPAGERTFYVQAHFGKDVSFRTMVRTPEDMNRWSTGIFFQLGLYYGTCMMFLMLNLFLYFYLKDRLFLYYGIFFVFISLSIAYADGLFSFLTSSSWLLNHADVPLHLGMGISCTLFAHRFLGLGRSGLCRSCFGILGLGGLAYLLSLVYDSYRLFLLGELLVLGLLCFFWILALKQFRGAVHARFFVFGYGLFLFCAIDYFLLRKVGIFTFDLYYGQLKMGSVIELVVITLAIMYRIRALDRQNQHYRGEIEDYMRREMERERIALGQQASFFGEVQRRYGLSDREVEVLQAITEGLSNVQIADRIFLSVNTIKFHTRNIFDKLEITSRTQAIGKVYGKS